MHTALFKISHCASSRDLLLRQTYLMKEPTFAHLVQVSEFKVLICNREKIGTKW